ncbi:ATP-binding protein [Pseudodesulfovibrio tunisiensis]|uniref:ATP-binding protein n=1 Tax=Pseudodesulfovibrio tunisiensis TaxID=463192 RepID=UPI001FB1CF55|nr:ATP-binding protein [Pseudodesulfovibrio tunisiensis]
MSHISSAIRTAFLALALIFPVAATARAEHGMSAPPTTCPPPVVAAVLRDFPPLYARGMGGSPQGFAIDLFEQVCARAGLSPKYLFVANWDEALDAVRSGRADCIPGIGISLPRKTEFRLTRVMETVPVSCFVRRDNQTIKGPDDLGDKHVAAIDQSAAMTLLVHDPSIRLKPFPSIDAALFSLLAGESDAFVFPAPVLWKKARLIGVDDRIKVAGAPLMELKRGYLLRKDDAVLARKLDNALAHVVGSETYRTAYLHWYGKPSPFWTTARMATASVFSVILTLCIMILWRYRSLRSVHSALERSLEARTLAENRLRRSEDRLVKAQKQARLGYFERDLATGHCVWSDEMFRIMGLTPGWDEPDFAHFLERIHPEDLRRFLDAVEQARHGGDPFDMELRLLFDNRTTRYADCHAEVEFEEDGTPARVRGSFQDITDRKHIEAELVQAKDRAEAASRSKSEFLANMSHELRTPLNGTLGMLQLLRMENLEHRQREYVDIALGACRSLTRLLGDILDLSKVEAGKMDLVSAPFLLSELLDTVRATFAPMAADKRVEIRISMEKTVPDELVGDAMRLRQIIFNLVGNALKFTDAGHVRVEVNSLTPRRDNEARLLFTVADTGIGISEDKLAEIFHPFTQAESGPAKQQGTGLGLHIVKRLSDLMGGSVSVTSTPSVGTTVHFAVGLTRAEHIRSNSDRSCPDTPEPGRRILIAEDDRVNRLALSGFVEKLGHVPVCVENGRQALDKLSTEQFDCVLLDVQMPVLDGLETISFIRNAHEFREMREIPVAALTARAMRGDREEFLDAGMDAYVAKPVDFEDLKRVLGMLLCRK